MKKFIITVFVMFFTITLSSCALASEHSLESNKEAIARQKQVSEVGFKLLNANRLENRVTFTYLSDKKINADANLRTRNVNLYRGIYNFIEDEDQLAAILAHEISHAQDSYQGILRGKLSSIPMSLFSMKYEYKSDKRAVDYMVKAGYNPVATIVIYNKLMPQYRYDVPVFSSHPLTTRRMANIYEYIYTKYPYFLAKNTYIDNVYYQNFLLTSRSNREKLQKKIENPKDKNKRLRYN